MTKMAPGDVVEGNGQPCQRGRSHKQGAKNATPGEASRQGREVKALVIDSGEPGGAGMQALVNTEVDRWPDILQKAGFKPD